MPHTISQIREAFLAFFESKGHIRLPSSPLIPHNDPTLMFTNAGMNQFKNVFPGLETLNDKQGNAITRATTSQKCVRAGGKHNDLDNVGYTKRHHTFFEMLGNFSFADYFKEGAIDYAWEFLTQVMGIPAEKLYVTVYHTDDEAFALWKQRTGFADEKILRIPTSDNFWSMGDTGPCGPCSEIFYDHGVGEGQWALDASGHDLFGERYVEIWNLVFMQFDKQPDGELKPLPRPCIDTGMGLERMASVMQGVHDNYDTDLFSHLIAAIKTTSGTNAPEHSASYKVIADHLRSCSFLLADGVTPSNEGRGYVLRRIMRRAMRHAHMLGCREPLMHQLVPALIIVMGEAYPELARAEGLITQTLKLEEIRFKETLERGLKLLEEEIATLTSGSHHPASPETPPPAPPASGGGLRNVLSGIVAFKLYDTYGFPLDLTQDILRGRNMEVDLAGFEAAMAEQKARARAAWAGSGETATGTLWLDMKDHFGSTEFVGYDTLKSSGVILAIIKDGALVEHAQAGETPVMILTNQTPFYAESGGQAGDKGVIRTEQCSITITDTKKQAGSLHAHIGSITTGDIRVGDKVEMAVDETRRKGLRTHHSATHLLHAALHQVLGNQVTQKGSLVEEDYFRFDFNHPQGLSAEEKQAVEVQVNAVIAQKADVTTRLMTPEEAIAAGAMALFGEKYGDEVRVLSMGYCHPERSEGSHAAGDPSQAQDDSCPYSIELCGGTHVANTGEIERFVIIGEGSVSSGIRRIEGKTGAAAAAWLAEREAKAQEEANRKKEAEAAKSAAAGNFQQTREAFRASFANAETLGTIPFVGVTLEGVQGKDLRTLVDDFKAVFPSGIITIIAANDGKASMVVGVTDDLKGNYSAVELLKKGVEAMGGKGGGGREDFAQGGAPDAANANAAIAAVKMLLG